MVSDIDYLSPLGASDHCVLAFDFNCYLTVDDKLHEKYMYDKGDYTQLASMLDIDWEAEFDQYRDDIDKQYEIFLTHYNNAVEQCIPRKTVYGGTSSGQTRRDRNTLRKIKKKHRAWQRFIETRLGQKHQEYCRERNRVRSETRRFKKQVEMSIARQSKNLPKKFWAYVNSRTKTRSLIPDLIIPGANGKKTGSDTEKAEVLSKYFASVFTQEPDGDIPRLPPLEVPNRLVDCDLNEDTVLKKLRNLNPTKSPGPDKVSPRVLKEVAHVVAKPLSQIYCLSLDFQRLPQA